jgi:hypothetical protein
MPPPASALLQGVEGLGASCLDDDEEEGRLSLAAGASRFDGVFFERPPPATAAVLFAISASFFLSGRLDEATSTGFDAIFFSLS